MTVTAAARSVAGMARPTHRDTIHARCGQPWSEHVDAGPPFYWPRCADEPTTGYPADPDEWTQQRIEAQRRTMRGTFAYTPDGKPLTRAEAVEVWRRQVRARGMVPVPDTAIVVLNTDGDISWVEGDVE